MRWEELCEMSCVSCEMSGNTWDELCELWDEWSSVNELCELWDDLCERTRVKFSERTRKQLHQMPHKSSSWVSWVVEMTWVRWVVWDELCELWDERSCVSCDMSGVVWDEFCELWDEWSCVRWVVWVVRCVELCEMSCVSCEMSCVKELGWSSVREHESSSSKCHTKAALGWVELCEMSCERWVVSDKLCDLWDERSCVKWVVLVVRWAEIREMSCVSCEMSGVV